MAYRVPLVFGSMAGLIIAAVIVLMIVAVAIFRRPDMRGWFCWRWRRGKWRICNVIRMRLW